MNKYYGQDQIDKWLVEHCILPEKGVIVDVGAGDGVNMSNSKHFEDKGWEAICIDADPRVAEALKKNRKHGYTNLISNNVKTQTFFMNKSTPDISGIIKTEGNKDKKIYLPAIKLETILEKEKIERIDILSIDTEGSEIDAFESMDFEKHKPRYLVIEFVTQGKVNLEVEPYFMKLGYKPMIVHGANMIFELPEPIVKDPHLIAYGSSYDRGLDMLLAMWPDIKKAVPDAKLRVFYGWNLFDVGYRDNPERMAWKDKINKLMEQDGITHLGRISHGAVDKEFERAGVWAYPTYFGEISCCVGDTPILMPRDHKKYPYGVPIKELVGKSGFHVYSYDHETDKIVLGKVKWVKMTRRNAKLLRITLDDGTILRFTPDHRFLLRNGEYKEAKDLVIGESLMPCYEKPTFAIKQTDGTWPEEHRMIAESLWGNLKGKIVDHKNGNRYDNTPDNLQLLTPSEHTRKIATTERVITNVGRERMSKAQIELGKTPERIEFMSKLGTLRANKFWAIFRTWSPEKQKEWTMNRQMQKNHSAIDISEDLVREDVYDMEVEKYHTFAAGGVFVHNCMTAMKAQAYGAVPCVIDYAALKETVQFGVKVKGDIYDKETQELFKGSLIALLNDPKYQEEVRKEMVPWAREHFAWSKVAKQWDEEFKGGVKSV